MKTKALYLFCALAFMLSLPLDAYENPYDIVTFKMERSFHPPITILLNNQYQLDFYQITVETYPRGKHDFKDRIITSVRLTKEQMEEALRRFEEIDFPIIYKNYSRAAADGSTWVFTATRDGSGFEYGFWTPRMRKGTEKMVEFVQYLFALAAYEIDDDLIY